MSGIAAFRPDDQAAALPAAETALPAAKIAFVCLTLFTVAIFARPEDIFPAVGEIHLTLILGICALLGYLGAYLLGNAPFVRAPQLRWMVLLTCWFMAGIPFAFWRGGSAQVLTQTWLKTLLVFFLLTQTLVSLRRIRIILWAIILSELAVTAYSVANPSQSAWIGDRMSGVSQGFLGWNFLGTAAALTIPFIAVLFIAHASFIKSILLAAATGAMMWMLVLTASRSGMITVALSILLTWLCVLRHTARGKFVGVGLILALALAIAAAPGVFFQRIQTIWSDAAPTTKDAASAENSEEDRRELLMRAVDYTMAHPVFGIGIGNFEAAGGAQFGDANAWSGAHNTFAQLSSEAGIPALVMFVVLFCISIRGSWRAARNPRAETEPEAEDLRRMAWAVFVSLLACVCGACFAHLAYQYYLYYPMAIAAAIEHLSDARIAADAKTFGGRRELSGEFRLQDA